MNVIIPNGKFNQLASKGTVGAVMNKILEDARPEAVYFTEQKGHRGAILIVDVADPSQVPSLAEPWFLKFDADVEFHVVMTPEDLKKGNLDKLGKKWS